MSIGTTIKRLRRERNMTQEQLADYLGVTSRAVSQWETDRTAPDISQLPVLAGVFNVSADVLLEIDNVKKEEAIRAFLLEYDRLSHDGKLKEKFDRTHCMYKKYPNDFRVAEKYMYELFNDPNYPEEPLGEEIHKEELYKLCGEILGACTVQRIRYFAMDVLTVLYLNDGMMKKAEEICEEFPESYFDTADECLEQLYIRSDQEKYEAYIKKNIRNCAEHLINKIRNLGTFVVKTNDEKISVYRKCLALIELMNENGDYGFTQYHYGHISCLLARLYYQNGDHQNARLFLEKGLMHSQKYDELPDKLCHTSVLMRGDVEDLNEVYNTTPLSRLAYEIGEIEKYADMKAAFGDILTSYHSFCANPT